MMIPESHTLKINSTDRCETLAHAVDDTEKERILSALEKCYSKVLIHRRSGLFSPEKQSRNDESAPF